MIKTVYVSAAGNFWRTHTDNEPIGDVYILKATALGIAVQYVIAAGEGICKDIRIQRKDGSYKTVWTLKDDGFPPKKIPLRKNKFTK